MDLLEPVSLLSCRHTREGDGLGGCSEVCLLNCQHLIIMLLVQHMDKNDAYHTIHAVNCQLAWFRLTK